MTIDDIKPIPKYILKLIEKKIIKFIVNLTAQHDFILTYPVSKRKS